MLTSSVLLCPAGVRARVPALTRYKEFVDAFGTHIMTKAYMGGAALLTTYFHKCFLEMYDAE